MSRLSLRGTFLPLAPAGVAACNPRASLTVIISLTRTIRTPHLCYRFHPCLSDSLLLGIGKMKETFFILFRNFIKWIFTECLLYIKPMPMIREPEMAKCKFFCLLLSLFQSESRQKNKIHTGHLMGTINIVNW